jgi:ribosomal protein L37AE/L43A
MHETEIDGVPECPDCFIKAYKSQGCYYCDNCGLKVRGQPKKVDPEDLKPIVVGLPERNTHIGY